LWICRTSCKTWCRHVAQFCPLSQNNETWREKSTCLKTIMFTEQHHVAHWCNRLVEAWPWLPFSSSFTWTVTTVTVQGLPYTTSYMTQRLQWSTLKITPTLSLPFKYLPHMYQNLKFSQQWKLRVLQSPQMWQIENIFVSCCLNLQHRKLSWGWKQVCDWGKREPELYI
jgi:hypothetical protein